MYEKSAGFLTIKNSVENVAAVFNAEFLFAKTRLYAAVFHFIIKRRLRQLSNLKIRSLLQNKERVLFCKISQGENSQSLLKIKIGGKFCASLRLVTEFFICIFVKTRVANFMRNEFLEDCF